MSRKFTHEEFVDIVNQKYNNNIVVLDKFVNTRTKIRCKCLFHNEEWEVLPTALTRKNSVVGCPICGLEKIKKSLLSNTEEFVKKLHLVNEDVIITSEYISANDKIDCECRICGNHFKMRPNSLLNGQKCPTCSRNRARESQLLSNEEFLNRLKSDNPNVTPMEKYKGRHEKILCFCSKHNSFWKTRPSELLNGHGCPQCYTERIGNALKLSDDEFKIKLKQKNPDIELIGEYINAKTHTAFKCKKCGHIWETAPNNLIYGKLTGCPKCQTYSKGEDRIKYFLECKNIKYKLHKTYNGLVGIGGKLLSYDFYLSDYNMLIEFQGEQHEHAIECFGGDKKFKSQQEHDKRKREYAKLHGIGLLEIWYWDYNNIEQILSEKLNINNNQKSA